MTANGVGPELASLRDRVRKVAKHAGMDER